MVKHTLVTVDCVKQCMESFDSIRSDLKLVPPKGSMLRELAESGIEMVDCYRTDTENFLKSKDTVTAFAAINYAHAWIGCFTHLGLFDSSYEKELFSICSSKDEGDGQNITDEKMAKYLDITTRARKKIRIAPPVRSFDRRLALRFLETSESYFKEAVGFRNDYDFVKAFAAVNYSHAWLDGGARMGLFDVEEDDVLFTLYD